MIDVQGIIEGIRGQGDVPKTHFSSILIDIRQLSAILSSG